MSAPSHVVITCECTLIPNTLDRDPNDCQVPGHGNVPITVAPHVLVEFGQEVLGHLADAEMALIKARAAWVSRGLPGDNPFPVSIDRLVENLVYQRGEMRKWTSAAQTVAERRAGATA